MSSGPVKYRTNLGLTHKEWEMVDNIIKEVKKIEGLGTISRNDLLRFWVQESLRRKKNDKK